MKLQCPIPDRSADRIEMAHGGGGRAMRELVDTMFRARFDSPELRADTDAAVLDVPEGKVAFTTDSFVVQPLFFPGADIGKLAVCGTVNDLATSGATPKWISVGLVLEEGLPMETLARVIDSIAATARDAGVRVVTGDTKVIERSRGDGLYVNTTGLGVLERDVELGPRHVRPGDRILVTGDIGRHGVAVMGARDPSLGFTSELESDCAPLAGLVHTLLEGRLEVRCLRDLTRGGLGATLDEVATGQRLGIRVWESAVPVIDPVQGACELLGLDPFFVANEGRMAVFVAPEDAERCLERLRDHPDGAGAALVGEVVDEPPGVVTVSGVLGTERILDLPLGEQLPRIC